MLQKIGKGLLLIIICGLLINQPIYAQDNDDSQQYIQTGWRVRDVQTTADGSKLAFITYWIDELSGVTVFDTTSNAEIYVTEHPLMIGSSVLEDWWSSGVRFSPDESKILSWSGDMYAYIWDTETGERLSIIEVLGESIRYGMWRGDGEQLILVTNSTLHLIDVASGTELNFIVMGEPIGAASYSPDSSQIMIALTSGIIEIFNENLGTIGKMTSEADIRGAVWHPDNHQIVTWSTSGHVTVWDVETESISYVLSHDKSILEASWSPNGEHLLVIDDEPDWGPDYLGRIWVYASETGELEQNYQVDGIGYGGATWSSDSQYLAAWTAPINYSGVTYFYDLDSSEPIYNTNMNGTSGVVWQQDMHHIILWSEIDGIVMIEDLGDRFTE